MAAISSVPFTKAFLVREENFSARVEFQFDEKASTLTLRHVNFWQSKDVVNLNLPLADDLAVPPKQQILLYRKAALIAVVWCEQFPREKQKDGSYTTTPWKATLAVRGNSPEEALLYWILYDLYPADHIGDFEKIIIKQPENTEEFVEMMVSGFPAMQRLIEKKRNNEPLTTEEVNFCKKNSGPVLGFINNLKNDRQRFQEFYTKFKKITFPQKLARFAKVATFQEFILALKGSSLDARVQSYVRARDEIKLDEMD